jgi:hypothetical protein
MRRFPFSRPVWALPFFALPLACISNNQANPGDDAGGLPAEDGAAPLPDATTGGSDSATDAAPTHDATAPLDGSPVGDAGTDAPVDAAPQPLVLHVTQNGAPESGVAVVFQDATGNVLSNTTTDATGSVSQLVTAGSQVTVIMGTATLPNVVTVQAVEPGDVLTFLDDAQAVTIPSEYLDVTLPAETWDAASATTYLYAGRCGASAGSEIYITAGCESNGTYPLLAYAQDTSGQEIAYTYQANNALVPDGGVPDGGVVPVTVSQPWLTPTATQSLTTSALPLLADGGAASVNLTYTYAEVSGGVPVSLLPTTSTTDGGVVTDVFPIHTGFGDFVQTTAQARLLGSSNAESVVIGGTRGAPPAGSASAAYDLSALPLFLTAGVDRSDAGVATDMSWTTAAPLTSAAGIVSALQWSYYPGDGGPNVNGTWTIVSPSSATSAVLPSLPAPLASWGPVQGSGYNQLPRVAAIQSSLIPGYAALRAQFANVSLFASGNWQATLPLLPANGTILVSVIYPNEG